MLLEKVQRIEKWRNKIGLLILTDRALDIDRRLWITPITVVVEFNFNLGIILVYNISQAIVGRALIIDNFEGFGLFWV